MGKGTEELSGSHLSTNASAFRLLLFFHIHGTRHRWSTKILLRMPKIGRGTGKEQAKACLSTMTGVSRIEFNTPANNTGLKNGACTFIARISLSGLYCIVLYLYIYIALLAVHTNQKHFQCERPREKRAVLRERKEALGSPVNKVDRVEGRSWFQSEGPMFAKARV